MMDKKAANERQFRKLMKMHADPVKASDFVPGPFGAQYPKQITKHLVGVDETHVCPKCGQCNIHNGTIGAWVWKPCQCGVDTKATGIVWRQMVVWDEKREYET